MPKKDRFEPACVPKVTIQTIESQRRYDGKIEGLCLGPVRFELTLDFSVEAINNLVKIAEAVKVPWQVIAVNLIQLTVGAYNLKVMRKNGEMIRGTPEENNLLRGVTFQVVILAIALLIERNVSSGTYRIPVLVDEEKEHFPDPASLYAWIKQANSENEEA